MIIHVYIMFTSKFSMVYLILCIIFSCRKYMILSYRKFAIQIKNKVCNVHIFKYVLIILIWYQTFCFWNLYLIYSVKFKTVAICPVLGVRGLRHWNIPLQSEINYIKITTVSATTLAVKRNWCIVNLTRLHFTADIKEMV